ncbi:MAG: PKD domain-containing protein [FCB group bacterium]|nr:PKD domain-containing protein [FCB group bacterium]
MNISAEYVESQIQTFSSIVLKNIQYDTEEIKEGLFHRKKSYLVTARVLKRDVARIFEERKSTIRTMLKEAIRAEKSGNVSKALKNYFRAFILTFSYPDSIQTSLPPSWQSGNARVLITEKMNDIFKGLSATVVKSFSDGDDFIVSLAVSLRDTPVSELEFSYYNGSEEDWCDVTDGVANLTLSGNFGATHKIIRPFVEYEFKEEMEQIKEVRQVYDFLDIPTFDNSFRLDVDISPFLICDFEVEPEGRQVYFIPRTTHVSVNTITWDFGDGSTSKMKNPVHTYERDGKYRVKLLVNEDEGLSAVKTLVIGKETDGKASLSDVKEPEKAGEAMPQHIEAAPRTDKIGGFTLKAPGDPPSLSALLKAADFDDFLELAKALSRSSKIIFGGANDFENRENLLCFVFDKETGEKLAAYRFRDDRYENLENGEELTSLKTRYSGIKVAAIWVEELE